MNTKMKANIRTGIGSNKAKKLRYNDIIPGVIYRRGEETKNIEVNGIEFTKLYKSLGTTSIIDVEVEGETIPVIIKNIQKLPIKDEIIHIDFQGLKMDEKLKMTIPITLLNRENIRLQPSILLHILDQVEIECLPKDIPQSAEVDVEDIDFTTPKFVKDLNIAKDEKITILTDLEAPVCSLSEPAIRADEDAEEETVEIGTAETENTEE